MYAPSKTLYVLLHNWESVCANMGYFLAVERASLFRQHFNVNILLRWLTLSSPVVPNGYTTKCSKPYWSNPPFLFFFDVRALCRSVLNILYTMNILCRNSADVVWLGGILRLLSYDVNALWFLPDVWLLCKWCSFKITLECLNTDEKIFSTRLRKLRMICAEFWYHFQ